MQPRFRIALFIAHVLGQFCSKTTLKPNLDQLLDQAILAIELDLPGIDLGKQLIQSPRSLQRISTFTLGTSTIFTFLLINHVHSVTAFSKEHLPLHKPFDTPNPVPACVDAERAESLATAFIFAGRKPGAEPASGNAEFFNKEAAGILKVLLHAAALADKNMSHVVFWAKNVADRWDDAAEIIRSSDDPRAERSWVDDLRNSATGTSKSTADTQKTLQQLISPVATTAKLAWLTPSPERVEFDPSEFVTARDTLYIVCDSNRPQNLAPLCAMLLQAVVDAGKQAAAHTIAGRLDPPMRLCGDELTNVAPLPTFPDLLSDARGWGLQVIAAWQSDAQLKQRWGDNGAAIINDNLTVEVILPGVRDTDTLARVSKLVGEVSVVKSTHTVNGTGAAASVGAQTVEKVVLRADEIRRLGEHHPDQALLVHRTMSAVMVRLPRWFDGPDAITLRDDQAALADARRTYARASNA